MTELELLLRDLGTALDVPPPPALRAAVVARIAVRRRRHRALVLALAALAVAVVAAFAVPPARAWLLDWIGIGSTRVELVDRLPVVRTQAELRLGTPTTPAEARRRFGAPLPALPVAEVGRPDETWFDDGDGARRVTFVWGSSAKPRLLLQVTRGLTAGWLSQKLAGPGTTVRLATVNGRPALGLLGAPHDVLYLDATTHQPISERVYLAGNVFLWQLGDLTLRLEGDLGFAQLLRLAERTR